MSSHLPSGITVEFALMYKQMIGVMDGVLEKEVAKIRRSDQSDAVGLNSSQGAVLCKRKTYMGLEQR